MRRKTINELNILYPGFNVSKILPSDIANFYKSLNVPKFEDIIIEFNSLEDTENYVNQKDYIRNYQLEYGIYMN